MYFYVEIALILALVLVSSFSITKLIVSEEILPGVFCLIIYLFH